jgi:hypothetical protein
MMFSRPNMGTTDLFFVQQEEIIGCPVLKVTETVLLPGQATEVISDACSCMSSAEQW